MRGLTRAGINSNLNKRRDMALFYLKANGEFDTAIREWEAKNEANKTWTNIKSFISTEYTQKENKQNKLTAKQFKAKAMEEHAKATEELINALTENHTRQMEALICSMTEAMKEMMTLVKFDNENPINANNGTNEKKTKWQEKQNKYKDAPVCKHCNRKHPNQQESKCWEHKSNTKSRPTWWRPNKST
jgi:hypothetical protein